MKYKKINILLIISCFFLLCGFKVTNIKKEDALDYNKESETILTIKKGILGDPVTYPSTYDLRNVDDTSYVPEIKDRQDAFNPRYFAYNNAIESNMLMHEQGTVNFSENYYEYLGGIDSTDMIKNSDHIPYYSSSYSNRELYNFSYYGYGPMTETEFGDSYLTVFKEKDIFALTKQSNSQYQIKETVQFPSINSHITSETDEDTVNLIKASVDINVNLMKEHITNDGALLAYLNPTKSNYIEESNMFYCPEADCESEYYGINIIGWDDTKSYTDENENILTGAWLAMDNNGNDAEDLPIFYISYYETEIYNEDLIGIKKVIERDNTNEIINEYSSETITVDNKKHFVNIFHNNSETDNLDYLEFNLTSLDSLTGSIKIYKVEPESGDYIFYDNNPYLSLTDVPLHLGRNYIDIDNLLLPDEHYAVETSFDNSLMFLYVKTSTEVKTITIYESTTTSNIDNKVGSTISINYDTYNIRVGEDYSITVFDDDDNDITDSFDIKRIPLNYLLSDIPLSLSIKETVLDTESITVKVTVGDSHDTVNITLNNFDISGLGTEESPYLISEAKHLMMLKNGTGYYKLTNNIDMGPATNNKNGIFFGYNENSDYTATKLTELFDSQNISWNQIIKFSGVLDGDGYSITNFTSSTGPLFSELYGTVKNLRINNSFVNVLGSEKSASVLADRIGKAYHSTLITNVEISNSKSISSEKDAYLIGNNLDEGSITIINCSFVNNKVIGKTYGSLIGKVQNTVLNNYIPVNTNISKNIFSNNTIKSLTEGTFPGYAIGNVTNYLDKSSPVFFGQTDIKDNYYEVITIEEPETGVYYPSTFIGKTNISIVDSSNDEYVEDESEAPLDVTNNTLVEENRTSALTYSSLDFENIWKTNTDELPSLMVFNNELLNVSYDGKLLKNNDYNFFEEGYTGTSILTDLEFPEDSTFMYFDSTGTKIQNTSRIGTGTLIVASRFKALISNTMVVPGDVTGDGYVNVSDVMKVADSILLEDPESLLNNKYEEIAMNVNYDDRVNVSDVTKIADHAIDNTISLFPLED